MTATAIPSPRTLFDSYFRSADVLLTVYRLLEAQEQPNQQVLFARVRAVLDADPHEELFYLLNDMFLGVVREHAQLPLGFFRQQNMALLLRQSVVAACTALDVYFPALLRTHLPTMIQVKQRNFVPNDKDVKAFLKDVTLTIDDHLRIVEDLSTQYHQIGQLIFNKLDRATMSNVTGITVVMKLLDIADPWAALAVRLQHGQQELRGPIEALVKRRNAIVHQGDREPGGDERTPRSIDYSWASLHVRTAQAVVHACDELVKARVLDLVPLLEGTGQ